MVPAYGNITELLKPEYVKAGWRLSEDEDFLYLYAPGSDEPFVYSSSKATVIDIEKTIAEKSATKPNV
jgi:hypothetical protein